MILSKILFILYLINYLNFTFSENVIRPIFQFIVNNEALCGDAFENPLWLPALEDCQIDCDISSQICQERTDKGFPGQRCIDLPFRCRDRIKQMLNLDPDMPALQLPLAPLTTPSQTNSLEQQSDDNEAEKLAVIVPISTPPPFHQNNIIQPPPSKIHRDHKYSMPAAPAFEPMPPSYNSIDEFEDPTTSSFRQQTKYYSSVTEASQYINNFVTIPLATMPPEYEDERNVESLSKEPTSWEQNPGKKFNNDDYDVSQGQNYDDYGTKKQPPYQMSMLGSLVSRANNPWSWIDLEKKLKHRQFYSVEQSTAIEDFSQKCCEWALNGLCDRSWQRIRNLCQKSCGTVICKKSADGNLSCNRAIDVDVLDCFQRRRFYELPATSLNYQPQNYPKKQTPINKKPLLNTEKDTSFFRAYAIENEIKGSSFK